LNRPNDRPRSLGLLALGLGGLGLLLCLVFPLAVVSVPLCLIGAVAGTFGVWGARSDSPAGLCRMSLPLGGAALSSITLCVAMVLALEPAGDAHASTSSSPSARGAQPRSAAAPAGTPTRELSIVGSHPSAEAASIFAPKTAPARPAAPAEPPPPIALGNVQVYFHSARFAHVMLIGEQSRPRGQTTDAMLMIKLVVRNTSTTPILYHTFAGDENNFDARAAILADERGVRYRRGMFDIGVNPVGRVSTESLLPGRSLTDTLVFQMPPKSATELTLTLQGRSVGASGSAAMKFSTALVSR
jgi:hypothetical protein